MVLYDINNVYSSMQFTNYNLNVFKREVKKYKHKYFKRIIKTIKTYTKFLRLMYLIYLRSSSIIISLLQCVRSYNSYYTFYYKLYVHDSLILYEKIILHLPILFKLKVHLWYSYLIKL